MISPMLCKLMSVENLLQDGKLFSMNNNENIYAARLMIVIMSPNNRWENYLARFGYKATRWGILSAHIPWLSIIVSNYLETTMDRKNII